MPPEDPTPNPAASGEPAASPARDPQSEPSAAAAATPAGAAAPLSETSGFRSLGLPETMLRTLDTLGYEAPSPIQSRTIPLLLTGRDILGQAQTGTGKTAAFALPVLARIDLAQRRPQAIVLTPTRELAIQVAEAFQRYAAGMPGFHVLPIYGGQSYPIQLRGLDRGVHVVVGTPGRLMDHLRRGSLDLKSVKYVVLDEADEMLRMGFLDDVTWILDQTPPERQTALFSATMPPPVRRIAQKQMHDPVEITIESRKATADLIRQRFWIVSGTHKLDALTRILEAEDVDGMLVFVRTKTMTTDLAERLEARGFACAPLSGDVPQAVRERTVDRFKSGGLDVLIATDVAARGLDVERVSHVVNFDVPTDTESYVHRIGRTGRAGRRGDAILFVAPRERHMLHAIERTVGRRIEPMALPTTEQVNEQRISRFKEKIAEALESEEDLATYSEIVADFVEEHEVEPLAVAAALARMVQGDKPLLFGESGRSESRGEPRGDARPARPAPRQEAYVAPAAPAVASQAPAAAPSAPPVAASAEVPASAAAEASAPSSAPPSAATPASPAAATSEPAPAEERETPRSFRSPPRPAREFTPEPPFDARRDSAREGWRPEPRRDERFERPMRQDPNFDAPRPQRAPDEGLETFRIEVGLADGVRPANIVGAIANEAGIEGRRIGRIELYEDHATVDLPIGMPDDLLAHLGTVRICGRELRMTRAPQVRRHAGGWGGRNAGPPVNREGGRPPFRGGAPGDRRGPGGPGGPGFRRGAPRDDRDGGFEHRGPPRRW